MSSRGWVEEKKEGKLNGGALLRVLVLLLLLVVSVALEVQVGLGTDLTETEAARAVMLHTHALPASLFMGGYLYFLPLALSGLSGLDPDIAIRSVGVLAQVLLAISIFFVSRRLFPLSRPNAPLLAVALYLLSWGAQANAIFSGTMVVLSLWGLLLMYQLFRACEERRTQSWFLSLLLALLLILTHPAGALFFILTLPFLAIWIHTHAGGLKHRPFFWAYAVVGLMGVGLWVLTDYFLGPVSSIETILGGFFFPGVNELALSSLESFVLMGLLPLSVLGVLGLLFCLGGVRVHYGENNVRFVFWLSLFGWIAALPFLFTADSSGFWVFGGVMLLPLLVRLLSYRYHFSVSAVLLAYGIASLLAFYLVFSARTLLGDSSFDPNQGLHLWKKGMQEIERQKQSLQAEALVVNHWRYGARAAWYSKRFGAIDDFYVADTSLDRPRGLGLPVDSSAFVRPKASRVLLLSVTQSWYPTPPPYFKNCQSAGSIYTQNEGRQNSYRIEESICDLRENTPRPAIPVVRKPPRPTSLPAPTPKTKKPEKKKRK